LRLHYLPSHPYDRRRERRERLHQSEKALCEAQEILHGEEQEIAAAKQEQQASAAGALEVARREQTAAQRTLDEAEAAGYSRESLREALKKHLSNFEQTFNVHATAGESIFKAELVEALSSLRDIQNADAAILEETVSGLGTSIAAAEDEESICAARLDEAQSRAERRREVERRCREQLDRASRVCDRLLEAATRQFKYERALAAGEQAAVQVAQLAAAAAAAATPGESKRLVVESPWSQFTSECQRF
jgi:hypothetical protein